AAPAARPPPPPTRHRVPRPPQRPPRAPGRRTPTAFHRRPQPQRSFRHRRCRQRLTPHAAPPGRPRFFTKRAWRVSAPLCVCLCRRGATFLLGLRAIPERSGGSVDPLPSPLVTIQP